VKYNHIVLDLKGGGRVISDLGGYPEKADGCQKTSLVAQKVGVGRGIKQGGELGFMENNNERTREGVLNAMFQKQNSIEKGVPRVPMAFSMRWCLRGEHPYNGKREECLP